MEDDLPIDTVQEFGPEDPLDLFLNFALHLVLVRLRLLLSLHCETMDVSRLMRSDPTFDVITTIVLRKSTLRPFASVRLPSSKIWRRILKTSGWAFSISSSRMTVNSDGGPHP